MKNEETTDIAAVAEQIMSATSADQLDAIAVEQGWQSANPARHLFGAGFEGFATADREMLIDFAIIARRCVKQCRGADSGNARLRAASALLLAAWALRQIDDDSAAVALERLIPDLGKLGQFEWK